MTDKICFKCKLKIFDGEHYFAFVEFNDSKMINTNYAHKKCWDEIKQGLSVGKQASGMLKGMNRFLIKQGIIPEKEEEYQIT